MEDNFKDLITEYLSGELPADIQAEFEEHMAADPDFAKLVAFERELMVVLHSDNPENKLRTDLQRISEKFDTPHRLENNTKPYKPWIWWVFSGGLLLIAGIFYWSFSKTAKEPTPLSIPVNPIPPAQAPVYPAPDLQPQEETPTQRHEPPTPIHKPSLTAAAYKPLPIMEAYIGSQMRSGGLQVSLVEPQHNTTLPNLNGYTTIRFAGNVSGVVTTGARFNILIFNNNPERFESMRPIENHLLPVESNGRFLWEPNLQLTPGLYYFLISEDESGDWLFVDKFFVQ